MCVKKSIAVLVIFTKIINKEKIKWQSIWVLPLLI